VIIWINSGWHVNHQAVEALVIKWHRAVKGLEETQNPYVELTARLDSDLVDAWTEQAEKAAIAGGDSLKIYNVDVECDAVIPTYHFIPAN
jgi:hypothetical protein